MRVIILLTTLTILASANYEKAKEFYEKKEYQKAVDEAKASTTEYSNPKLHLIWAKSEEALGNMKQAMSAYERVVMLDENDTDSRVKLVQVYNNSNRKTLAKGMSSELKNYQLTPEQRSSLELLEKESISTFKAKATLSVGHDSNINVSADSEELNIYYNTLGLGGEKATLFARVNGSASYINDFDTKGGWYTRGDMRIYYQSNFDASLYNMFIGSVEAGIGYAGNGYTLYLPIGYDRVHYLDTDMLSQIKILPKANITLNDNIILNLNAKYTKKTYNDALYKRMNDKSYGVGAGLYYLFDKNFVYMNFMYENFSATETLNFAYIDKTTLTTSLGLNYNVADIFTTRVDYRYRKADYSDGIYYLRFFGPKRSDDYNQVELKVSHYFGEHYELFISDRYIKNFSNYIPAKYSKNIAMFGLSANY